MSAKDLAKAAESEGEVKVLLNRRIGLPAVISLMLLTENHHENTLRHGLYVLWRYFLLVNFFLAFLPAALFKLPFSGEGNYRGKSFE